MNINVFPHEILSSILVQAAEANAREGVNFSFGLSQAPLPGQKAKLQRYVKAPLRPDVIRWNATDSLRHVCRLWHSWSLKYALDTLWIKKWRGGERWADLPLRHTQYRLYEMIDTHHPNAYVAKQPYDHLTKVGELLARYPAIASNIRRMWFHGFFGAGTDQSIFHVLRCCPNVTTVTLPWTALRHLGWQEWSWLLGDREGNPIRSLELLSEDLTRVQMTDPQNTIDLKPLDSTAVNLGRLRKLKITGETSFMPVKDNDLFAIARSATKLEEFYLSNMSSVTIDGVMAIVKASQSTLRVLEHAPRSNDGFWHPHPGSWSENEHICELLTSCPKLQTVSLSVPTICAKLFANENVKWEGDFQVRSLHICGHTDSHTHAAKADFRNLLVEARALAKSKARSTIPKELFIEIFFADFIFEPHLSIVHGDFQLAELSSGSTWPADYARAPSRKGPYGSSGLWEKKEEEGIFEQLDEAEFVVGLQHRYLTLDHHNLN
ncbi:hypothetical protein EJ05DRAFT_224500 [Pseudovirgaria hyperparasitica]|uniref:F-box domain-containing protein n=1 Tax=Pseudovirgaria hyperparasitica TaxID=470096 RepID=A0A6A6VSR0_9PEZI|nr:uncharacterized protein EJ05DRAFT_224500 [Pseudovirgaria hyperparasitica]KAF2753253.1 hypothetical protein EJ05DRAFT_224500 [Pseudovirgaria hyperparasitica]